MRFEQSAASSSQVERRSSPDRARNQIKKRQAEVSSLSSELEELRGQVPGTSEQGAKIHAEAIQLELEGEAIAQEGEASSETVIEIEEDENIDYRGPEKQIEHGLEAIVTAFQQEKITEEQLGILIEQVSRKSIKDALKVGIQTGYDREKMLKILGRTAELIQPEDEEYEEDKILEHLRYVTKFTDPAQAAFLSPETPTVTDRAAQTEALGEQGRALLSELNGSYEAYVDWKGSRGRKEKSEVRGYAIGKLMTKEEHDSYRLIKEIEPILAGEIEPKKMRQIIDSLPLSKEVKAELEGLYAKGLKKGDDLEEKDIPKTYAYAMSLLEAHPLYEEHKKRKANGTEYDDPVFFHAWEEHSKKTNNAINGLLNGVMGEPTTLEEARALMEVCGVPEKEIEQTIKQKRKKLDATTPLLMRSYADRLEGIKERLEKKKKNSNGWGDSIQKRIDDITAMQESLRTGNTFTPKNSGSDPGFNSIETRFQNRTKKEVQKINIPVGFLQGLKAENSALPGYTFIAKNDAYTHREYDEFTAYLRGPREDQSSTSQIEDQSQSPKGEADRESYQDAIEKISEQYFEPVDSEESIDGDPSMENPRKLMEVSRPLHTVMIRGVYDQYDKESHLWHMSQGLPEPSADRKTKPVIAKIPFSGGKARLPLPLYASIPLDRVVGVGKGGEAIPVKVFHDEKGFVQVEVSSNVKVAEIMYEIQAAEAPADLTDISQREYQAWAKTKQTDQTEKETREIQKSLPPECSNFLKTIENESPQQRVIKIERFVRSIGFYDFANKETFGSKRHVDLSRRMEVMRTRMNELHERHPQIAEQKILAGVCTDFQELTTAMMKASGLRAGRLAGLRVSGEQATVADSHALSYVEWPDKNGERQIIPVDGTPASAVSLEQQEKLRRIRETTVRTKTESVKKELSKKRDEPRIPMEQDQDESGSETSATKMNEANAQTNQEIQRKTFGEKIDEKLSSTEKHQLQALRDVLMYSPLKQSGSAWLRDPSNKQQIRELLLSTIAQNAQKESQISGTDLQRMWSNLVTDWSVPDRAVTREDLTQTLANISDALPENLRTVIQELVETK